MKIIQTQLCVNKFAKCKGKDFSKGKYNPFAVCTESVGNQDSEKFDRCIKHVKNKNVPKKSKKKAARQSSVPEQHQKNIAIKTLKMNDIFSKIMGGMNKDEARDFLTSIGYSPENIARIEGKIASFEDEIKFARCKNKGDLTPNPFAVCHTTVDKDKDPDKYDRCVKEVSEKAEKKDVPKKPKKDIVKPVRR